MTISTMDGLSVLVDSKREVLNLPPSDKSPLVGSRDFAAPKEVSFHSHRFTFTAAKFSTTLCSYLTRVFRIMAFRFRLDMPVVFGRAPPWEEQRTFRKAKTQTHVGKPATKIPFPPSLSIGVARRLITDAP